MPSLLHEILVETSAKSGDRSALRFGSVSYTYAELLSSVKSTASGLSRLGVGRNTQVAILIPNSPEAVIASFAVSLVGGVFVPVSPLLRPHQIAHILRDSRSSLLITTPYLYESLTEAELPVESLQATILVGSGTGSLRNANSINCYRWEDFTAGPETVIKRPTEAEEAVAILYTSGSTGPAKGVVVSHANMVAGARIVSSYLENRPTDKILAALPLSFDYGFSQVTTAFYVGAEAVLVNYSLPQMLISSLAEYAITGLAGVPTMWAHLSNSSWPESVTARIRYITNSGGRLPEVVLSRLKEALPNSKIFLMYGLTEAFRSTFLDPDEIDKRPDSIGKAIPEVEINVVQSDGMLCGPDEVGELVHSGQLVSLGYWNDPTATAARFKPFRPAFDGTGRAPNSVWSGDNVRMDRDGFLYFIGRSDDMIKSSGYRISPTEIEEVVYSTGLVEQVVAFGIDEPVLGQRIALAIVTRRRVSDVDFELRHACAKSLPPYMQPGEIRCLDRLPYTANRKPDRQALIEMFSEPSSGLLPAI